MAAGLDFEFRFSRQRIGASSASGAMRILVLADFSGHRGAPLPGLAARRPRSVDLDKFDDCMARLTPAALLPAGLASDEALRLEFTAMEQFEADLLATRVPLVQALASLRRKLDNPATFDEAARSLRGVAAAAEATPSTPADSGEEDPDTLARLLGSSGTAGATATPAAASSIADRLIAAAVAPHIVADADPRQAVYTQWVDQAMSDRLRSVLRCPAVRGLERSWRSLYELVGALDPDEDLEVAILDVTAGELLADLAACGGDVSNSGLYEAVQGHAGGAADMRPWTLLVADLEFGASPEELDLLSGLAALAAQTGSSLLAGAAPALLGAPGFANPGDARDWATDADAAIRWQKLRRAESAEWVALAAPRIMLRLPYGKAGERCECCKLNETRGGDDHEGYLWGSAAFALARLLGLSFRENGWDMEPGDVLELEDLPAHVYDDADGDPQLKPAAEGLLNERSLHAMLEKGISALGSYRDRNAARLLRLQSIAQPATALAGRWRGGRD